MSVLKSQLGRASAVLTTGEVAGTSFDLEKAKDNALSVDFAFTQGMLTNGILRFYASMDNTNWDTIYVPGATGVLVALSLTLTADGNAIIPMPPVRGYKWFRATLQGTGTVTNSLGAFTYRWVRRGAL